MAEVIAEKRTNMLHLLAGSSTTTALEAARSMLSRGANPRGREDEGLTPLHVACAWDNLPMVQLLLHFGADALAKDDYNRTPFNMSTGNTQRFLQRHLAKNTFDRRSALSKLFMCYAVPRFPGRDNPITRSMRAAKNKVRRSFNVMARRKSQGEGPSMETEPAPTICPQPTVANSKRNTNVHRLYPSLSDGNIADLRPNVPTRGASKSKTKRSRTPDGALQPTVSRVANAPMPRRPQPTTAKNANAVARLAQPRFAVPSAPAASSENLLVPISTGSSHNSSAYATAEESFDIVRDMQILEQKLDEVRLTPRTPISVRVDDCRLRRIRRLRDNELRAELKKLGVDVGPIDARTRRLYEKKLLDISDQHDQTVGTKYSRQLELAIADRHDANKGKVLNEKVRTEFAGSGATAFVYLLLDPRKLPADSDDITFEQFVKAVFYVGKGTKARPLAHLIEARKDRSTKSPAIRTNPKLQRIDSIWRNGRGVISHEIYHSVSDHEAFVREAAIIEAMKVENLTNHKSGSWHGSCTSWDAVKKAEFGVFQLQQAATGLRTFGYNPILPDALPDAVFIPFTQRKR